MKNLLLELEDNGVEYFIVRSEITCGFEYDDSRSEIHVYHKIHPEVGKWNNKCPEYPYLKFKPLSKSEVKFFRNNQHLFKLEINSGEGCVWVSKRLGFNKKAPHADK